MSIRALIERLREESEETLRWKTHSPSVYLTDTGGNPPGGQGAIVGGRARNAPDGEPDARSEKRPSEVPPRPMGIRPREREARNTIPGGIATRFGGRPAAGSTGAPPKPFQAAPGEQGPE